MATPNDLFLAILAPTEAYLETDKCSPADFNRLDVVNR